VKVLQPPPYIKIVTLMCVCVYGIVHGLECLGTDSDTHLSTE
jgi:hypothetical protein